MQTKIHCRKHTKCKTAKQRPDETTTAKSNTCSQKVNPTEATNWKDRKHSKEARHLANTQRERKR